MKRLALLALISVPLIAYGCASKTAGQKDSQTPAGKQHFIRAEAEEMVKYHNKARADAGVLEKLEWSEGLAEFAQAWSEYRAANGCNLEHRPHTGEWAQKYGENAFMGYVNYHPTILSAKSWEEEKTDYHGEAVGSNSKGPVTGHYTQMVWRNTAKIGCGKAQCGEKFLVFCNYYPSGNYIGQKPY